MLKIVFLVAIEAKKDLEKCCKDGTDWDSNKKMI